MLEQAIGLFTASTMPSSRRNMTRGVNGVSGNGPVIRRDVSSHSARAFFMAARTPPRSVRTSSGSAVIAAETSALALVSPSVRSLTGQDRCTNPSPSTRSRTWPSRAATPENSELLVPPRRCAHRSHCTVSTKATTAGGTIGTSSPGGTSPAARNEVARSPRSARATRADATTARAISGTAATICRASRVSASARLREPGCGYPRFRSTPLTASRTAVTRPCPSAMECETTRLTAAAPSVRGCTASRQPGPRSGSMGVRRQSSAQDHRSLRGRSRTDMSRVCGSGSATQRCRPNGSTERSMRRPNRPLARLRRN